MPFSSASWQTSTAGCHICTPPKSQLAKLSRWNAFDILFSWMSGRHESERKPKQRKKMGKIQFDRTCTGTSVYFNFFFLHSNFDYTRTLEIIRWIECAVAAAMTQNKRFVHRNRSQHQNDSFFFFSFSFWTSVRSISALAAVINSLRFNRLQGS